MSLRRNMGTATLGSGAAMRVLVTGWFSFLHGEATVGDVLALDAVTAMLARERLDHEVAWSPVFKPGAHSLETADPDRYTHLLFVCGPVHGAQLVDLHQRFAHCRRIAVGVSVVEPDDPAVLGFHTILARDGVPGAEPSRDLARPPGRTVPVVGVALATGQGEYGERRRHDEVTERLTGWLAGVDCGRIPLETRLDSSDWRLSGTAEQFTSIVRRVDVMVTTRLHGLVVALCCGVPALAVDPVAGGGKVTAQATAWGWPAVLPADHLSDPTLDRWWRWCLSEGKTKAAKMQELHATSTLLTGLADLLRA